jgi:hypothetical protein
MAIDSQHPLFTTKKSDVTLDAYKGDVKEYVNRLRGHTIEDHEERLQRGYFFNMVKRTTDSMVGTIMRKPYIADVDPAIHDNLTFGTFISNIIQGVITQGRVGILVDYDEQLQRPKLIQYDNENIINWRDDHSLIVLKQHTFRENEKDHYKLDEVELYRELYLDQDGFYQVRVWEEIADEKYVVIDEFTPTRRGQPLTFIPFVSVTPYDIMMSCDEPVVYNLAQINISHYKSVLDIEHGAHFTALPQPYIAGDLNNQYGSQFFVGATHLLVLDPGTQVGYLEFSGAGLDAIEKRIDIKHQEMTALGAQLMSPKRGIESADALTIRSTAQTASLINIARSVENAFHVILQYVAYWEQPQLTELPEVKFELNKDFVDTTLSAADMKVLMDLYLNGTISQETYLENLFHGEITPDVEEEMRRLGVSSQRTE